MRGSTQKHWHHRVPKEKGRRPRININFRLILPNQPDTERGQKSYYKSTTCPLSTHTQIAPPP